MAIEFNGTKPKVITFNGTDITNVTLNNSIIWCKPFSLTITTSGQIERYFVTRTVTSEPFATVGEEVHNGSTLYYGDSIKVEATAASGHKLNGVFPYTIENIKDNVTVSISASPTINSPSFEVNIYRQTAGTSMIGVGVNLTVSNSNNNSVECYYKVSGESVATTEVKEGSKTIPLNSSTNVGFSFTKQPFINKLHVEVYFKSNHLTPIYSETVKQTFTVNV